MFICSLLWTDFGPIRELVNLLFFSPTSTKLQALKHCTKQGMTAMKSNPSQSEGIVQIYTLLPFNQPDPQGLHHWSLSFTHQFSQISRSRNAHSGMQLLTCGISFRHLFIFHLQVLSHPSLIHIMDQSVTCLMVHFILVLKPIFSSSHFLPRSVSSFTHWSAGTFNCPLCGRIWRFKCRQVQQIKPAQLAFGHTIK